MSVLDHIAEKTRDELRHRRDAVPLARLEAAAGEREEGRPFQEALTSPGLSLIAEHKRQSPSAGVLRADTSVTDVVRAFERGGAVAVSILTEPFFFAGSLDDLREARAVTELPVLRKDFIIDPYQVYETAAAGADAILLTMALLEPDMLTVVYREATALDLDVLVEVHSPEELDRALEIDAEVLSINNRNLDDFSIDMERTFELLAHVPTGKPVVSESGITSHEQLKALEEIGVDAVLIGEALMRAPDIETACREFTT